MILEYHQESPMVLFCLDGRPHLKLVQVARIELAVYRSLLIGGEFMTKRKTKRTVLPFHQLKSMKLPTILGECEKLAARCAADNVDHLGILLQLCEQDLPILDELGYVPASKAGSEFLSGTKTV